MGKLGRAFLSLTRIQHNIKTSPKTNLNHMFTNHIHYNNNNIDNDQTHSNQSLQTLSRNKELASYVNNGMLHVAQKLFDEMPLKDVVTWNTMLLGFRNANDPHRLYRCFLNMLRAGFVPSGHTISLILSAVLCTEFDVLVTQFHTLSIRLSLSHGLFVGSALIRGYADIHNHVAMKKAFDDINNKDVSSFNALLSGYMRIGLIVQAQRVFDAMPVRNVVSWTSLINGYIRNKKIDRARFLFEAMSERNVVTWTAMIRGYVENKSFSEALELFLSMTQSGVRPNDYTFSIALVACAGQCSLLMGRQVHSSMTKGGAMFNDVVSSSALVDMYAKCGDIDSAYRVFDAILDKNVIAWNSILGGYSRHGDAIRVLALFERMTTKRSGMVGPDRVTFVNVLSACARSGMVEAGEKHFRMMEEKYRIRAGVEHYSCMVDLYGRAREAEKAAELIAEMPVEPDAVLWGGAAAASLIASKFD